MCRGRTFIAVADATCVNDRNPANGKETRLWCDACGTLLLGKRCSVCGSAGRPFEINSPGDIRPCMGDSVGTVMSLLEEAFGTAGPFEGCQMFFNKVPGEDRTDEVVAHGRVVAVLRFDLREDRLRIELKQGGAELLAPAATRNTVRISGVSGHLKGKGVEGANVAGSEGDFAAGDPLIVIKGAKVGTGTALVPSQDVRGEGKTVRIRDLGVPSGLPVSPPADRRTFVAANRRHLEALERKGVSEIRDSVGGARMPVTVAFSGGKDSLAAYGLAAAAVGSPELIFTDTGLEFPETLEYVSSFAKANRLRLHRASGGNGFRENVDAFGPPAKDYRWCCKVCKLGPITDLIASDFPRGTITVEGNRALESFSRADTPLVSRNPFIPNQTVVNPVRGWCASEVWGYIWMKGLEYNPLYERDYERLGCYLCPACLASEWRNTCRIHPGMYHEWEDHLHAYAERKGLPPEYVDMGFWRWRSPPPKMRQLAGEMDIRIEPEKGDLALKMLKGASVCAAGGFSAEAVLTVPGRTDFDRMAGALVTVGPMRYSPEYGIAMVDSRNGRAKVFGGGQVSITSDTEKGAQKLLEGTLKALVRAEMCTSCGICAKVCPRHAIRISGGLVIDPDRCDHCGKCTGSCMVVHYYDKIVAGGKVPASSGRRPQDGRRRPPPRDRSGRHGYRRRR